ncbi:hypothetical protein [[Mycoplasma] imitans]|uniref:hypothetical protein n=1 Tax=[Mycoplasma] imitans TaxID=29560 RepID=UPI000A06D785
MGRNFIFYLNSPLAGEYTISGYYNSPTQRGLTFSTPGASANIVEIRNLKSDNGEEKIVSIF